MLFFPPAEGPLKSWSAYKSRLIPWSDFQDSFDSRPWTLDIRALDLMKASNLPILLLILAVAMYVSGKYLAAINIWENICLIKYRRILGTHPFTASVLDYLGNAYQKYDCPQEAVKCKRESLEMRRFLLGT